MNLRYITCSDPREDLQIADVISFLKISPMIEIGVQAAPGTMGWLRPRNVWFDVLMYYVKTNKNPLNVAVHVNYQWCDDMCSGKIPGEIAHWMRLRNKSDNKPSIRRWQLNIGDRTEKFDANAVAKLIREHPENEFIFPYNECVKNKIDALHKTGAKFLLLYDSSYGYGICPEKWNGPVYEDVPMGYAGGLSPENVVDNLNKISKVVPKNYTTWIDAEGRLMKPGTREFDLGRARAYVQKALAWQHEQNKR